MTTAVAAVMMAVMTAAAMTMAETTITEEADSFTLATAAAPRAVPAAAALQ